MLQGSLDDFALDEVLGLLASTNKTGKLEVKGDRGTGSLRFKAGRLVDAGTSNTANGVEPEDVLFELLRFGEGNFHFSASESEDGGHSIDVPEILDSAERRLADWRTIEAVVPSLRHLVSPVAQLPEEEITLVRREWDVLIVVGSGCPVSAVCEELDLGEVEGSRRIKELTERGLVAVGPPKTSTFRRSGTDGLRSTDTPAFSSSAGSSLGATTTGLGAPKGLSATSSLRTITGEGAPGSGGVDTGDLKVDSADPASALGASSRVEPPHPSSVDTDQAPSALAIAGSPTATHAESVTDALDAAGSSGKVDGPAPSEPLTPKIEGAPTIDGAPTPPAPPVRQPMAEADSERSGGLLMRYLKND